MINLSEIGVKMDKRKVEDSFRSDLKMLNDTLPSYQRISTVIIDSDTWSVDNDLITPTLKVKRPKLDEKFGGIYLFWHNEKSDVIWV